VLLAPRQTSQAGGPPLVGCPRLLIQCIRTYPPYPQAVPSSATWGRAMLWWQGPTYHGYLLIIKSWVEGFYCSLPCLSLRKALRRLMEGYNYKTSFAHIHYFINPWPLEAGFVTVIWVPIDSFLKRPNTVSVCKVFTRKIEKKKSSNFNSVTVIDISRLLLLIPQPLFIGYYLFMFDGAVLSAQCLLSVCEVQRRSHFLIFCCHTI
jgi:hypothetical protein